MQPVRNLKCRILPAVLLAGGMVFSATGAHAELPPQYTVWRDFSAITAKSDIPEKLGIVDRIERTASGSYLVHGGKCTIEATIVRESARSPDGRPMVGPSRVVRVDLGEKRCN